MGPSSCCWWCCYSAALVIVFDTPFAVVLCAPCSIIDLIDELPAAASVLCCVMQVQVQRESHHLRF